MGWKLNLAIVAGVGVAIAAAATIFQKQIRNAAYTTGQTFGSIPADFGAGFIEPFQNLFKSLQGFSNNLSTAGVGGTPQTTSPIVPVTPVSPIPASPGQQPPLGAPGNDDHPGNTMPGNIMPSNATPGATFPGTGTIIGTIPPGGQSTITITTPSPPATPTPTPQKKSVGNITVNYKPGNNFASFFGQIGKQTADYGQAAYDAALKAWDILQKNPTIGTIVVPGLPSISIPIPQAFAQPSNKTQVNNNDKTILQMGAVSTKPLPTQPITSNPGTFYSPAKVAVPGANPNQAQIDAFAVLFAKQKQQA